MLLLLLLMMMMMMMMMGRYQKALKEKLEREHAKQERELAEAKALNDKLDEVRYDLDR